MAELRIFCRCAYLLDLFAEVCIFGSFHSFLDLVRIINSKLRFCQRLSVGEPNMSQQNDASSLRWVFLGNLVHCTGNPFALEQQDEWNRRCGEGQEDDETTIWLGPGLQILLDHILTVDRDGVIQRIEPHSRSTVDLTTLPDDCKVIQLQAPYEFLCPGMVDLHIHAPQFAYTGTATDRPLMGPDGWLETYTFPAERRLREDLTLARSVYESVVQTTLKHGTTTAVYFATLDAEPCRLLVDVALEKGQRALVGKVCMDRNSPADYCQSTEQNLEETKQLMDYIYQRAGKRTASTTTKLPLVLPLVTPRFIPTCTPQLLEGLGQLARQESCHITSHISESLDEIAFSRQVASQDGYYSDDDAMTDARVFHSHQLLTDQCIMAHGVWLSDADRTLLHRQGTAVAHCPLSNFFFADAILPCRELLERGHRVGLGSDVAGGYSPSVLASRALEQQRNNRHVLDFRHAFYLATLGGAQALRLQNELGSLEVGKQLDAFVFKAEKEMAFAQDSLADVFQKLCNLGDDRHISQVFVAGRDVKS